MLVIRNAQLAALSAAVLSTFERKMVAHLRRVYPEWARSPEPELVTFVRHGLTQASRYGFTAELEVARYLHVMHDLGPGFDESPEHRWAKPLLTSDLPAPTKMDRLRDAAQYQLEANEIDGKIDRRIGDARRT